jgi:sugar O-acyltransferase (sialic acid O-acetyltransferase NeuD family)
MKGGRDLILIGCGGFGRETAAAVNAINSVEPRWRLLGFLDDSPGLEGTTVSGLPVLGPIDAAADYPRAAIAITTGRPDNYVSRSRIARRLGRDEESYATLIHPTAAVGTSCSIGPGSVLLANVTLTTEVTVGRHVAAMPQVVLPHDTVVGDFATLASGARVGGGCEIGSEAYMGSGSSLREGLRVGSRALVGMGAVVTRDVPPERLWCGFPARDTGPAPIPEPVATGGPGA